MPTNPNADDRPAALVAITWVLVGLALVLMAVAAQQLVLLFEARRTDPNAPTAATDAPFIIGAVLALGGVAVGVYRRRRVAVIIGIVVALTALILVSAVVHPAIATPA